MIILSYVVFSSGCVFFCCPLCVYVLLSPFISPQTDKKTLLQNTFKPLVYMILYKTNKVKSKKVGDKSKKFIAAITAQLMTVITGKGCHPGSAVDG